MLLQLQEIVSEFASSESSSSQDSTATTNTGLEKIPDEQDETSVPCFEETVINGQKFSLIPTSLVKYVPTSEIITDDIVGLGHVDVGSEFVYVPAYFLPQMKALLSRSIDLQHEVTLFRELLWSKYGHNDQQPPFDPEAVKVMCQDAGATSIFQTLLEAMSVQEQTPSKLLQNEKKVVAALYMLVFGQSQKASWFQKVLSQRVVGKGISETGLSILNKSGVSVSKSTQKRERVKLSFNHDKAVSTFVSEAVENKDLLVLMIDDYTNIHTKSRPNDAETSTAISMATILLKRFQGVPAIPSLFPTTNPKVVDSALLEQILSENISNLSSTYASVMPHWIRTTFFDPEMERKRMEEHDYQEQQSCKTIRQMKDCRLIDELELPLKSFQNFLDAATHAVNQGLHLYLSSFVCPFVGDWPAQFFMRQVQYNLPSFAPLSLQNIVPFIGPLHIQLNARESVCLLNIEFFKKAFSFIFGARKHLSNKPKPNFFNRYFMVVGHQSESKLL
ncbi:uncharacterized protein LOC135682973 [Rhopilema esculentum]|uniref:uncharacterized protein LOC135682973 n=1 Tax=Rhopilema esculentum TaxID=499914 RepID=UPI0031DB09FF